MEISTKIPLRQCRVCRFAGPLDMFIPHKLSRFGRKNLCRPCWNKQERERKKIIRDALGAPGRAALNRTLGNRFARLKYKAQLRGIDIDLTRQEWEVIVVQPCHYCNGPLAPTGYGLDRKDPLGIYTLTNVVPCCQPCNRRKKNQPYDVAVKRLCST